jgi:hypothetical protein
MAHLGPLQDVLKGYRPCSVAERQRQLAAPPARNAEAAPEGTARVERMTGFEPATSTLARWRSSQLSYIREASERYRSGRDPSNPHRTGPSTRQAVSKR